jgi:hypothetical protein
VKILEDYKKIAKNFITEAAWDRKFGEPLPTLEDVMKEASQDDDDYVHIGYGKYKDKDHVDDPSAPTFKKDDSGAFVPSKGGDKKKSSEEPKDDKEEPNGKDLGKGDFKRDFDPEKPEDEPDDEPPFGGDTGKDADFGMSDDWEDDEDARAAAFADMEDEFGDEDEWEESIKVINGKKYKPIKESVSPTALHPFKKTYKKIGGK